MNQHLAEERLALARDLHDSIGHHLAVANIQTGVARALALSILALALVIVIASSWSGMRARFGRHAGPA